MVDQTELENSGGNLFTEGAVEGVADAGSDEDWFRFEADYDANWLVVCTNAGTYGATSTPSRARSRCCCSTTRASRRATSTTSPASATASAP